ncbi:hypothetical protein [Paraburkholderia unamae]|uniref:Uncharacterized protein n=1 Tax=Paraburkholderia unamae TaxID=219649 RepID=A0ACC6RJ12_9BURK
MDKQLEAIEAYAEQQRTVRVERTYTEREMKQHAQELTQMHAMQAHVLAAAQRFRGRFDGVLVGFVLATVAYYAFR